MKNRRIKKQKIHNKNENIDKIVIRNLSKKEKEKKESTNEIVIEICQRKNKKRMEESMIKRKYVFSFLLVR